MLLRLKLLLSQLLKSVRLGLNRSLEPWLLGLLRLLGRLLRPRLQGLLGSLLLKPVLVQLLAALSRVFRFSKHRERLSHKH